MYSSCSFPGVFLRLFCAIKLAAEVSDLSEPLRRVLLEGTGQITARLAERIEAGIVDGSLAVQGAPQEIAAQLYQSWLGASLLAKITRDDAPLRAAMAATRSRLGCAGPAPSLALALSASLTSRMAPVISFGR